MLFFSQFVWPPQRKLGWPFSFILSCDQHRKLAGLCDVTNSEYWRFFSEIILLWDQQRELACLFGLFDLYYCATNTENWHAFFISSIVRTTQNTVFFIWVCIIVRSRQKTGGPFFSIIFILLCYQHKVLTFFYLRLYYCAIDTENWCAFLVLIYSIMRPTHKTGVHSSC